MFIQISGLINQPVYCLETKSAVGRIHNFVTDPQNGQVVAFLISVSLFGPPKILSTKDIIAVKADLLLVQKELVLVEPKEIIKVEKLLKDNIKVLGNWVKTDKGDWIGKVEDLLIDTETFFITKYYIQGTIFGFRLSPFLGTLKENRIISAENIIKIKSKAIIVKGEEPKAKVEEKEKVKATIPEPA